MDEEAIQQLYSWIDEITLSRPKRNITRDFSDGVLAAEIVGHFLPDIVEIHNYTPANSSQQKRTNWETLNRKVFKRIDFNVPSNIVSGIVMCKPGVIEIVLYNLRVKILNFKKNTEGDSEFSDVATEPEPWAGNAGNPVDVSLPAAPPQYYPGVIAQPGGYPTATQQPYHQPYNPPQFQQQPQQPQQKQAPRQRVTQPAPPPPQQPRVMQGRKRMSHQGTISPQVIQTTSNYTVISQGHNNGTSGLATIPFEGEKVKKKTPKKKTTKGQGNAQNITGAERSRSMPNSFAHLDHESRIFLQEKEQQLMQSQEVIQILQSKISRLEHLLQLKDLRIEDLSMKLQTMGGAAPRGR